ncbi:hypothetical protein BCR35DRAFT_348819 [Leucosporidium creatinivorum]|uniref:F-box domain-containing protein n=1 Tax=Leucosporidium creatinivorum TaxID=106004 RepID=A0A1Y2G3A8_9BASI|nr:hypothetical protein BCR35DRAFT_348819 [Leucosporidium creatinivorum]
MEDSELLPRDEMDSFDASPPQDSAPPELDVKPFPLLRLPEEILFIIGQHLLLKDDVNLEDIRSLRCTAKPLASVLRPLAWSNHRFAPDSSTLKASTKQLLSDAQLQSYVRHAEWRLPAMIPVATLPLLKNLRSVVVKSFAAPALPLNRRIQTAAPAPSRPIPVLPFGVTHALRSMPQLRRLAIDGASSLADETFSFAEHLPSLRHLDLFAWSQPILGGQNIRILHAHSLLPYRALVGTVETLVLDRFWNEDVENLRLAIEDSDDRCVLRDLVLSPCEPQSPNNIINILQIFNSSTTLQTLALSVEDSLRLEEADLLALESIQLPALRELRLESWSYSIARSQNEDDPFLLVEALLHSFPSLRSLTIEGDWSSTVQVSQLLNSGGSVGDAEDDLYFFLSCIRKTRVETVFFIPHAGVSTMATFDLERTMHIF